MALIYSASDFKREKNLKKSKSDSYRSPFARDYSRLIHSPSFRRLAGKTQLYPGSESDFFRNRLTHSVEVSDIAVNIAKQINNKLKKGITSRKTIDHQLIDIDLVRFSALAHDLGHPPFGHIGEAALDEKMKSLGRFEGNAQTLRLLSKIEKKDLSKAHLIKNFGFDKEKDIRLGLNLTSRSLASILKYPEKCLKSKIDKEYEGVEKGYYKTEESLVEKIKKDVLNGYSLTKNEKFKTVECYIMDLADDIAYTTYDLEDALKANFVQILDIFDHESDIWTGIIKDINSAIRKATTPFYNNTLKEFSESDRNSRWQLSFYAFDLFKVFLPEIHPSVLSRMKKAPGDPIYTLLNGSAVYHTFETFSYNGYFRNYLTSTIVKKLIDNIEFKLHPKCPALSKVYLKKDYFLMMEVLKKFIFHSQIKSPRLSIVEYRGKEIVSSIFDILYTQENYSLLPNDYRYIYDNHIKGSSEDIKARLICDFISGMTDRYAVEFYGRLKSENPETIFKPL